jgi:hypothetical protein
VHTAAVNSSDRLRQEARGQPGVRRYLTRGQLVELHLIRREQRVAVGVVQLELRWSDLWVILLVLKGHSALRLGERIDEYLERVLWQRVVIPTTRHQLEANTVRECLLSVATLKEKALAFYRDLGGDLLPLIEFINEIL